MQAHHTLTKIRAAQARQQADEGELAYLEDLCLSSGYSDYLDEIVDRIGSSRSYYDGATDEREYARALSYAGFATAYRF